jgi:mono/diheme cytochrome c family protein/glucose/arabinose dehydrogenase
LEKLNRLLLLVYCQVIRQFNFIVLALTCFGLYSCNSDVSRGNQGPSPEKTPEQERATFQLAPGLKIELVASEPMVQDPVVITFDPDGRLWIVEMRGFMPDIDGKGENQRVGRISILEDADGDGRMDASKIYIDSLIMPRAVSLVPGGALIVEDMSLWLTQDLNGDDKADIKTLIDSAYAGNPSPEHSGNGLWRNMDNWYYNAKSVFRYRLRDGHWIRDSTEFRGQWGLSHDDEGRLYYNYNWSQLHADLVPPNYLSRNENHKPTTGIDHGLTIDRRIYPIRPNPAVNRGYVPGTLDKKGSLLEFTAACSPLYYRGRALPQEYYGNVFVCEPSGNLVKRNVVKDSGIIPKAHDPTPGKEFLASTDERFRPVFLATGPDGALYIADMYRGLVQHGLYVTPYLREQTLKRNLVKPINRGRIWRIVPDNWKPTRGKKLSHAPLNDLVALLSNPDGWYRDVAQRLLVESRDKSLQKNLEDVALTGDQYLGRFHALWTLEGLDVISPQLLFRVLKDSSILVRTAAIRLLERFAERDANVRAKLGQELAKKWKKAGIEEALQISLSAYALDAKAARVILTGIAARYDTSALIRDAVLSSLQDNEFAFLQEIWKSPEWESHKPAHEIFLEMLTTAVVTKRNSEAIAALLAMMNTKNPDWKHIAVVTALSVQARSKIKPIRLQHAPAVLTSQTKTLEPSQLQLLSAMFQWPGHLPDTASINQQVSLNKNEQRQFVAGRQLYLTTCAGCHGTDGKGLPRFAPPLTQSEWVLGDERRLSLIILHGIEGPIDVGGKRYDAPEILTVMPAHSTLDDASISSILTYIRNEWGNAAGAVGRRVVGMTRVMSQGRVMPWTAKELDEHIKKTKSSPPK